MCFCFTLDMSYLPFVLFWHNIICVLIIWSKENIFYSHAVLAFNQNFFKKKGNKLTYYQHLTQPLGFVHFLDKQEKHSALSATMTDWCRASRKLIPYYREILIHNELMTSGRMEACEDGGGRDESWSRNFRFCSGLQTRYALRCCRNTQIRKFTRVLLWMWRCYVVCVYLN